MESGLTRFARLDYLALLVAFVATTRLRAQCASCPVAKEKEPTR
jgi:hypothetical protein